MLKIQQTPGEWLTLYPGEVERNGKTVLRKCLFLTFKKSEYADFFYIKKDCYNKVLTRVYLDWSKNLQTSVRTWLSERKVSTQGATLGLMADTRSCCSPKSTIAPIEAVTVPRPARQLSSLALSCSDSTRISWHNPLHNVVTYSQLTSALFRYTWKTGD